MNNSLLPLLSSSQFKSFGSDDMNMDTNPLMLMDNIISFYDSSFCFNSEVCNDHYQFSETCNSFPFQPQIMFYQPGEPTLRIENKEEAEPLIEMDYLANYSYIQQQQPSSFSNKIHNITHHHQFDLKNATNTRKRSAQVGTPLTKNKKFHYGHQDNKSNIIQVNESEAKQSLTGNRRVPLKRSQRLSDKITALQKLVSPYGKTDTASVLEEASISIKLLQDQINDLFSRRNNLCIIDNHPLHLQKNRENEGVLRERALCLVPLSVTQELVKKDHF